MHLIIIGCEYVGKTTLAAEITKWGKRTLGSFGGFHDHFVMPFAQGDEDPEDVDRLAEQVMAMDPILLERYTRWMISYHLTPGFYGNSDHCLVNWYYGDAVYAPIYYGYGDRSRMARHSDAEAVQLAPDTVLVLMKASPTVIRQRKRENPHPHCVLKDKDVELILQRFDEEYNQSWIRRRLALDTTESTAEETLREFVGQMEPHLSNADRLRIVSHQALHPCDS